TNVVDVRDRRQSDRTADPLREMRGEILPLRLCRLVSLETPGPEAASALHVASPASRARIDHTVSVAPIGKSRQMRLAKTTAIVNVAIPTTASQVAWLGPNAAAA